MSGWGPDGCAASVSVTFDHFGEAAEIEAGAWPAEAPLGQHHSVSVILPEVLSALEKQGVRATFYVEAWNAEHYPSELRDMVARGHEVACHSYRHENWEQLGLADIDDIMARSMESYRDADLPVRGVRPPGGVPPLGYAEILRKHEISYVSIAEDCYGAEGGLAHVPFQWRTVDGGYYTNYFAKLRKPPGKHAVSVDEMLTAWDNVLDETVAEGGHTSFIFHVPWQDSQDRVEAVKRFAERVSNDDRLWVAPAGVIADWMLGEEETYPYSDPGTRPRAWTPEELAQASALSPTLIARGRDS